MTQSSVRGKEILAECRAFYKNLYSAEPVNHESQQWLLSQLETALSSEDQTRCEGKLTLDECHAALSQMAFSKSPGSDGLSVEFYCRFWGLLGADLVETLNFSFAAGFLSNSQRRGVIRLLYKKDDPLLLKNWRPISLLNIDYKICTKALANRLRAVLPLLVHQDQTCGVPGRSIFENLFLIRDTIDYVHYKNIPAAIISLDQEKAFDRVNHAFLQRVLSQFNFGPDFTRWIAVIYNDISSVVVNNGWVSSSFPLARGVRQGCPLSPLLYCLVAETLGQAIRRDRTIEGINLPGCSQQSKVSQYADDTTLILANEFSITRAFDVVTRFEHGSGSRLNLSKTEGLWIGSCAGRVSGPVHITWVGDKLKILGIYFGLGNLDHANWADRVAKFEKRLNLWKLRTLSLKGKSMIINTIGASGLWYTATVLSLPKWVHSRVKKAVGLFLWSGKAELVKRDTCRLPFDSGGLAVVHALEKSRALKLRWVRCIGDLTCTAKWVHFARYWIGFPLSRKMKNWTFLRSNTAPKHLGDDKPLVYQHLLTAVDRIGLDFDLLPDHHVKTFYQRLAYPTLPSLPCTTAWDRRLATSLSWPKIWSHLYGGLSTNWECDIAWKIAHGVLKTRAYLKAWGLANMTEFCAICGRVETITHALYDCPQALPVWRWISSLLNQLYPSSINLTPALAFFCHGLPGGKHNASANKLTAFLCKLALNEVWSARNLATFESKRLSGDTIIAKIKSRIRTRVWAAFNFTARPDFIKLWTVHNVICTYDQRSLRIFI